MENKRKLIESICRGKTIRIFSARPDRETVSFVETYRNCGNAGCSRCRSKKLRPHGPYWNLNYFDDRGKQRTLYVGRLLPEIARVHDKVLFSDILTFQQDRQEQAAAAERDKMRISRLKEEVDRLYEELRSSRRKFSISGSGKAEKLFKQLAVKYHPDRHPGKIFHSEEVMKDLNQLYQTLR